MARSHRDKAERIAPLWAQGLSAKEIGRRLGLPKGTVCGIVNRNRDLCPQRHASPGEGREVSPERPRTKKAPAKAPATIPTKGPPKEDEHTVIVVKTGNNGRPNYVRLPRIRCIHGEYLGD